MFVDGPQKITQSENSLTNVFSEISLTNGLQIYPKSYVEKDNNHFFIAKKLSEKSLFILFFDCANLLSQKFEGEEKSIECSKSASLKKCPMNHNNAVAIRETFDFCKPSTVGLKNSFGFGDRIGLANAGHIRSLEGSNFYPVLTQQSIRELTRTERTADEVMDAAVWAVFQEGYRSGFGADADHLKTTGDIDRMIKAGYTMFTFDPSEYVNNDADQMTSYDLRNKAQDLPWCDLNDNFGNMLTRYENKLFDLGEGFAIESGSEDVIRAIIKYGGAIVHINNLYKHLIINYSHKPFEVEVSVDETESVTTPFEHFFIASELNRLGVKIISLAPRFIGEFEKGIDYKGDIEIFKEEYLKHVKVSEYFGSYKISLHSGSDKFSVYKAIGSLKRGYTHVKTAGTSYLEALKVVAIKQPDLFRKILDFCCGIYDIEKFSYHVSAELLKIKHGSEYSDKELLGLFESNNARQVLHVTFGKVLTTKTKNGGFFFRDKIKDCLIENEELHYEILIKHFKRHLDPFNQ